ncbi:MAG: RNA polymerase sigma factor [Bacteroidota bacterium]
MKKPKKLSTIIKNCQENNQGSERELYEYFFSYGMSVSLRYTASYEEAAEVLNDSFMKVFQKIGSLKKENFKSWFRRIIINTATDLYRKQKKYDFLQHEDDWSKTDISAEELITAQLSYQDLMNLVQQLTPAYRAVFNLYVIDGYKHEEIADVLKISVGSSKSNLSRARDMLKKMIKKTLNYEYTEAIG